ncbi:MAG: hypothetical protein E6H79_04690, partial [Betaproteobacteria bacterium]
NWALYVENYLEGLHIPFVHPGLTKTLDLGNYRYELRAAATRPRASRACTTSIGWWPSSWSSTPLGTRTNVHREPKGGSR